MRVADTSLLYAFFNRKDHHHDGAVEALRDPEPIDVPHGVLQETLDLLAYRHGKTAAVDAHDYLLGLPHVAVVEVEHGPALVDLWRGHKRLSYVDAQGVHAARESGADLLSHDKDQHKALG